jgi:drug/metabolite transporter (DMT)-like permease
LVTVYIVWGSTYLAIRTVVQTVPPFLMAGTRFLLAGIVLYLWRRRQGDPAPSRRQWLSTGIVGLCLLLGGNGGVVWAEQRVPSGIAALMVGAVPLWMILLDALRPGGQRPTPRALAGVVIGFAGIALLLIDPAAFSSQVGVGLDLVGAVVLILAALSWSVGSLYSRHSEMPDSPLLGTGMEMMIGGAGLLGFGLLTGDLGRLNLAGISSASILAWLYLVVFGSWVGFTAYTWLLRVAPVSLVSTYAYVNPVVAVVLGYFLAGEELSLRMLIAAAVIVGAVALTTTAKARES